MVLAAEFIILIVQIHPRQGYCGGADPPPILQGFCYSHLRCGGLVVPDDAASLNYRHSFGSPGR